MKNNLSELVFILDRSGSMSGLESDTIGGFNSLIAKQKKLKGDAFVTTVLFDHEIKLLHDREPLCDVEKMTERDYTVRGNTALIDAIGYSVEHIRKIHRYIRDEDVPEHTVFVITTDGFENASFKYTSDDVKRMIEEQKEKGWEFLFLGANINAVETAKGFGIGADRAVNYHCDAAGTAVNFAAVGDAMSTVRGGCEPLTANWKAAIEMDFKGRRKR